MMEHLKHQDVEERLKELARTLPPQRLMPSLREFAGELLAEGYPREALLDDLEHVRAVLRERGQEEQEDAVMDVMDFLTGWCANHMKL